MMISVSSFFAKGIYEELLIVSHNNGTMDQIHYGSETGLFQFVILDILAFYFRHSERITKTAKSLLENFKRRK